MPQFRCDPEEYIRLHLESLEKIESHLSRIADSQEKLTSPFLMYGGQLHWSAHRQAWVASAGDHRVVVEATGPTPQAAVDSFNEAFKGGKE